MPPLRKLAAEEFVLRLFESSESDEARYALFLGAGCSKSSLIPTAGELVEKSWLPRLRRLRGSSCTEETWQSWIAENLPAYDRNKPYLAYGQAMDKLFLQPAERQLEIESICSNKYPGFGYAILSTLIARQGGTFSTVLTTNFDDLLADAMYLFTESRPLVIPHESLTQFIRPSRIRPLIVKVHGDHQLSPLNTNEEIAKLKDNMNLAIRSLLHDRGLLFFGYRGNDEGILRTLQSLPGDALPRGVFWVNRSEPQGEFRTWLERKGGIWVEFEDFDRMMLLLRDAFGFEHPSEDRISRVFDNYHATYRQLSGAIEVTQSITPEDIALKAAARRGDEALPDAWAFVRQAEQLKRSLPSDANAVFKEGLDKFPVHSGLLGSYANFLAVQRRDFDQAETFHLRAIDADPTHANVLGNYANFLAVQRRDFIQAETFYLRAIEADSNRATTLGNYAGFLLGRGEIAQGEELLHRSKLQAALPENLQLEIHYYEYANVPSTELSQSLASLKTLILKGVRSEGWDFSTNIEQAEKADHPEAEWLPLLAAVITDGEDEAKLNDWPAWLAAINEIEPHSVNNAP